MVGKRLPRRGGAQDAVHHGERIALFHPTARGGRERGALIISVVSIALNLLTGNARVNVQRRPPGPPKTPGGGNGPVIDV